MPTTVPLRVMAILTTPRTEWPVIAEERDTVIQLYLRYIAPLSAIGPLALVLRFFSVTWIVVAVLQYLLHLAALYLSARIIEHLAPRFKSKGDATQVLKLVAYAATPAWAAAILSLAPALSLVVSLSVLYSVYLYYLGLSPVMGTPPEQVVPYMLVSAIVIVVAFTLASAVVGGLVGGTIGMLRL
jgi:Yip1 domain